MLRAIGFLLLLGLTVSAAPRIPGDVVANGPARRGQGSWKITFENGVVETCTIDSAGKAKESEPLRTSAGMAERTDRGFIIRFEDDRLERWTPIGQRVVVEHYFPSAKYPDGPRVLGIAERTP